MKKKQDNIIQFKNKMTGLDHRLLISGRLEKFFSDLIQIESKEQLTENRLEAIREHRRAISFNVDSLKKWIQIYKRLALFFFLLFIVSIYFLSNSIAPSVFAVIGFVSLFVCGMCLNVIDGFEKNIRIKMDSLLYGLKTLDNEVGEKGSTET